MMITLKEYAARKGLEPSGLRRRIQRGTLNALKVGRDWLIDEDEPLVDNRVKSGAYKDWRKPKE